MIRILFGSPSMRQLDQDMRETYNELIKMGVKVKRMNRARRWLETEKCIVTFINFNDYSQILGRHADVAFNLKFLACEARADVYLDNVPLHEYIAGIERRVKNND